ncbi:prenyltransferase/squalene oxidase repeat-containing protein [Streptomyces sp. NPDC002055]|uniref:prenyltransferase/squalene oxidase repeat-containing protein n=1 Tax=Streptomyces sp. NPDC002055 TaxID=3154534 RepID=UPI003330F828
MLHHPGEISPRPRPGGLPRHSRLRRAAALTAVSAALCVTAAPAAFAADSPKPAAPAKLPAGLYGTKDPKFDAVWRQSVALIAQDTVKVTPAPEAVDWLAGQQCASGGFAEFRADAGKECDKKTPVDSNATGLAVQALAAVGGHGDAVKKAANWLKSVQNEDGGWSYLPGGPSDANSTSLVIGALVAAGEKPEDVTAGKKPGEKSGKKSGTAGKSPYDALLTFQLGCDDKKGERGAFAFQPDKKGKLAPNADATAAAALAGLGKGLVVAAPAKAAEKAEPLDCGSSDAQDTREPDEAAGAGAAYLAETLRKSDGHLSTLAPGADKPTPDFANTADAVTALAAGGHQDAARASLTWLEHHAKAWSKDNPAGLGALVLAAHATGADPRDFGGQDLVRQLNATGPKPAAQAPAEGGDAQDTKEEGNGSGGMSTAWTVGAFLVAGIGIGFLISGRKKKA